jgi:hypothetical protein
LPCKDEGNCIWPAVVVVAAVAMVENETRETGNPTGTGTDCDTVKVRRHTVFMRQALSVLF